MNTELSLFQEVERIELRWKPNCFVIIGDDVYFGGLSKDVLRANGAFRV